MKTIRLAFTSTLILLGFLASGASIAGGSHGGGGHSGHGGHGWHGGSAHYSVAIGAPIGWGWGWGYGYYPGYYPAPYYSPYYAPVAAVPYSQPTYVEQGSAQAGPAPQSFWYYCADSKAYYPYVNQCSGGWQRVSPTPPGG